MMIVCSVRIYYIATNEKLSQTAINQSTKRYDVASQRGMIYDCFGQPLCDTKYKKVTVILPTEKGAITLSKMLTGKELSAAEKILASGSPVTIDGECPKDSEGAVTLSVPIRYSGSLSHVLGYVDGAYHGVTGIEKSYDNILYSDSPISISYSTDSLGRILAGEGFTVNYEQPQNSVTLTIDKTLQTATEVSMSQVSSGATVIIEAETGKIRASVSRPDFDQTRVADYLDDSSSPLINRTLYAYNVGSVFKLCVAAAAIECGEADYVNNCLGSIEFGGLNFKCHNTAGHGWLDLEGAIAKSCNTYFYTLATKLGAKNIYNTAKQFRFGDELSLGGDINSSKGNMPSLESLESSTANLINLSIGQGDLLLSPIAISCLYSTIVNGGSYYLPSIVEGVTENGIYKEQTSLPPTKAMSKATAEALKNYLESALKNGTGKTGYTEGITAGGKTGTAQTGWKDGDRSILNGWFCGFYEGNDKTYVIIILKEDVQSGSVDCAPIFKSITEQMRAAGY